jgi:hypothetical protein
MREWVELKGWSLHPCTGSYCPLVRLRDSHALGKVSICLFCARQLFRVADGHLAWSLRKGEERQKERVSLLSGPPRGPQEPEAAPEVVLSPGLCSWTQAGKAEGGRGKMGGECHARIARRGRGVAMATVEGRGQV